MDVNNVSRSAGAYGVEKPGTEAEKKSSKIEGRTVGEPKLSETGKKYYDELRKKYGVMDFILVSKDMKSTAMANAASYATGAKKTVVLIDEEKIEKMATDEEYRKKYEGILDSAKTQIPELKKALANTPGVAGFGMQVNDNGTASFFAVMEKGNKAQTERIAKRNAEKKAAAKAESKKAEKKKSEERLEKHREENRSKADKLSEKRADSRSEKFDPKNYDTIEASSVEELLSRISDYNFLSRSDSVRTAEESMIGSHVDYSM